jgi:hypothetical protein
MNVRTVIVALPRIRAEGTYGVRWVGYYILIGGLYGQASLSASASVSKMSPSVMQNSEGSNLFIGGRI